MAKSKNKPETAAAAPSWSWDEMLEEFRSLGGVADNVRIGQGVNGAGIFPIDPARPVLIQVPHNLLFRLREVEFVGPDLRAIDAGPHTPEERDFFTRYQAAFSWGAGARTDCLEFLAMMDGLPEAVRELLVTEFDFRDMLTGEHEQRARSRYLTTRMIRWQDGFVLMPVLELVNHGRDAAGFEINERGIESGGMAEGEHRVRYNIIDPIGVFGSWGFLGDELIAFSLKMNLTKDDLVLNIGRDLHVKERMGEFMGPVVTRDEAAGVVRLSHLMIGAANFPRLSKGLFYRIMADLGQADAAPEVFDYIMRHNQTRFFTLLETLDPYEGPAVTMLRKLARRQLEAMSYALGSRAV